MQEAEEMQTKWIKVPRIAVFAFDDNRDEIGGNNMAKEYMETALAKAEEQWTKEIKAEVEMCSERYEPVDGADKVPTDSSGGVHGMAKCTYPSGNVYVGEWQHSERHGQGTFTWADGAVYVGEWQHAKMHGPGKYTFANGDFDLCFTVANDYSGEFVRFSKDRQKAWLLKDGKVAHKLSRSEAAKKVEELGLSELLKWVLDPIWKGFWKEKSHEELSNAVKLSKKWAKSCIILTAKATGIGFENYSSH